MATIDQQFVEFIVKSLVGDPDSVEIKRTIDEKGVLLELSVAQDDLVRVIGKRGATAQSMRTLLRALGTKNEARYNLKIIDPEDDRPRRTEAVSDSQASDAPASSDDSADDGAKSDEPTDEQTDEPADDAASGDDDDEDVEDTDVEEESEDEEDSIAARHRKDLEDLDD